MFHDAQRLPRNHFLPHRQNRPGRHSHEWLATPRATPGRCCPVVNEQPGHRDTQGLGQEMQDVEAHGFASGLCVDDGVAADTGPFGQSLLREVPITPETSNAGAHLQPLAHEPWVDGGAD